VPRSAVGPWTRRLLTANLAVQIGIVVTGGLVRLTGSGLGCPTWPQCAPGTYTPVVEQAEGLHAVIEFGNRLLTFVVGLVAVAALVAVVRHRPRRPRLVALAAVPLLGVVVQALLGGVTVLTGLHPLTVAAHFLVSMALVAASALLLVRAGEGDGPARPVVRAEIRWLATALAAVGAAVLVLGTAVTGSGPHSGDADTPARLGLDPRAVSWLHADAVLVFCGLLLATVLALRLTDAPERARARARLVLVVTLAQAAVGYAQYATGLPEVLVALHMLGASLLVAALVALLTALRVREDEPAPPAPPRRPALEEPLPR
jgi:heme a synthase